MKRDTIIAVLIMTLIAVICIRLERKISFDAGYAAAMAYRVDDPESRHVTSTMDRAVAEEIKRQEKINAEREDNKP